MARFSRFTQVCCYLGKQMQGPLATDAFPETKGTPKVYKETQSQISKQRQSIVFCPVAQTNPRSAC